MSPISTPETSSENVSVTTPTAFARGDVTSTMSTVGSTTSTPLNQPSNAAVSAGTSPPSGSSAFPAKSSTGVAPSVVTSRNSYVASSVVTDDRSSVYRKSVCCTTDKPEITTGTVSFSKTKSAISTPDTPSLKMILTVPTSVCRGSGAISIMSTVGAVLSSTQISDASDASSMPALSTIPESDATSVNR